MALHGDGFIKTYSREEALENSAPACTPRWWDSPGHDDRRVPGRYIQPLGAMSRVVSGKSVSGTEALAEYNRISRVEALNLFTKGAAWFTDAEAEMGRIAPGNLADFALLDRDYFTVPEDEINPFPLS
jgi:predicted amidohydrolase YtcJ